MLAFWKNNHCLAYCLWPLSLIYRSIIWIRRYLYRWKLKKTIYFSVPIIVVGNITVGGTGKTPLVIWLAHFLKKQGWRPGIVSRGYGGRALHYPYRVTSSSAVTEVGDEALLIVRKTHCPMWIDPKRVRAVQNLLTQIPCDVVISDDGLQHTALGRALEIIVVDGQRRFGNGFCLPAGPLREPVTRLQQADFVVINTDQSTDEWTMQIKPDYFYALQRPQNRQTVDYFLHNKNIHVIAAIGHPQRFFTSLRCLGLRFTEHVFSDHYVFKQEDLDYGDDSLIIMTEKDAMKCEAFADQRFWVVAVQIECDQRFSKALLEKLITTIISSENQTGVKKDFER